MKRELLRGAAAGALGAAVLNLTTYTDMVIRGRPASKMPKKTAEELAEKSYVSLKMEGEAEEKKENRTEALGALMGYIAGVGVGIGYGMVRSGISKKSLPVSGVIVGAAGSVAGSAPMVALGLTNPKKWGVEGWIMDLVPHMAYGFATVAAYEAMSQEEPPQELHEAVSLRR